MMLAKHLKNNQRKKQKIQAATNTKEKAPFSVFNIFYKINKYQRQCETITPVFGIRLEDVGYEVDKQDLYQIFLQPWTLFCGI